MPTEPQRGMLKQQYRTGYGSARVSESGYISNLGIREEFRGQGAGSELVGSITADADRLGKTLTMHARPELHEFYGKHGFTHIGEDQFGPILQRQATEEEQ